MGFCVCSMFCCTLLCVHSSFVIILMSNRDLVALLCLSYWCLVIVMWLFLTVSQVDMKYVIVVFSDHTHLLFPSQYFSLLINTMRGLGEVSNKQCLCFFSHVKLACKPYSLKDDCTIRIILISVITACLRCFTFYYFTLSSDH